MVVKIKKKDNTELRISRRKQKKYPYWLFAQILFYGGTESGIREIPSGNL